MASVMEWVCVATGCRYALPGAMFQALQVFVNSVEMKSTETPLMRQYRQIKSRHPDTILLFRLGDFFETFGDDAVATAAACGITLTKRNNGSAGEIPLAGFPHHQLDTYLPKLVRAGHRVAVCEQLEDPKQAKGIVRRDVVEIVTPGVVMYDKLLETKAHTYVAALVMPTGTSRTCGIAFCDVSTGTLSAGDIDVDRIASVLEGLQPAELIVNKEQRENWEPLVQRMPSPPSLTRLDGWHFDGEYTKQALTRHFATVSLKGFGVDHLATGLVAAGVILQYVGETQKGSLAQITSMHAYDVSDIMLLDAATRRNLEIHQTMQGDGRQGALVGLLDDTQTPMGGRTLRAWLQAPLLRKEAIEARLGVVRGFVREPRILDTVRSAMQGIGDLERLIAKVVTDRANARDLAALRNGLLRLPEVKAACLACATSTVQDLGERLDVHAEVVGLLQTALVDEPAVHVGNGEIVRTGFDATIDQLCDARVNGKRWLAEYLEQERNATGITTLKIGHTGVFGYYLEVTNVHKARVPEWFERKQTLANAERYTTSKLRELESTIVHAERLLAERESDVLSMLRATVASHCAAIQRTTALVGGLDCLASFANVSIRYAYCEPSIHDGDVLAIEGARHPVIERLLPPGQSYVANDVRLDPDTTQIVIITGPNMSGKSSYLRQVGLITFLAHVGCYVPATTASIPITDRIFTRVGAQDNIVAGESTFLVEMQESANILHNATRRSLILLDEVGRGTATFDGISIAWAIAEYLHQVVGAKTLFATHYHELTSLADQFPRVRNAQVEVREVDDTIVFTHRVVSGHSDHSFGIHVARMAGLPTSVITTASAVLQQLEEGKHGPTSPGPTPTVERMRLEEDGQLTMFEVRDDRLRDRVRELDVNNMTPLQALQALTELKGSIDG